MSQVKRVLLVGDPSSTGDLRSVLPPELAVRAQADGEAALADLATDPAELVIADWSAGHLQGISEFCRAIRARSELSNLHVIVAVPPEGRHLGAKALEAGADDYLLRPFVPSEVLARARAGLRLVELRSSEARLRALIANVPGAIYRCTSDADWTMNLVSDEIERISGYPPGEFLGDDCRPFSSIVHRDDHETAMQAAREATEQDLPFSLEYRIVRADGAIAWVLDRGQLIHDASGRAWLDGAIFDITERRRAEEELRRRETEQARMEELRASRARVIEAADAARRRIERDLHDGAQQRFVAATLMLRLVRARIGEDAADAARMLDDVHQELQTALRELRELAHGIHPAALTERGLESALEALAARAPLPVSLNVALEERPPAEIELAAYYVVAEALTNIAKYADARTADVRVGHSNGSLQIFVRDDGTGGADPAAGSGLRGLADRVEAFDGRFDVASPPSGGTTIRAEIPVRRASV